MPWTNADGLNVYFSGESRTRQGGEYPGAGALRVIEIEFNLAGLSTNAATPTVLGADWVVLPRNSRIEQVQIISEVAAAGGTSINFGTQRYNGTEYDHDGLAAAVPLASINATGKKNTYTQGQTNAGAQVGTTTIYPSRLVAYNTGTFTAGKIVARIDVYVPEKDANPGQV